MNLSNLQKLNKYLFNLKWLLFTLLLIDIIGRISIIIINDVDFANRFTMFIFLLFQIFFGSFFFVKNFNFKVPFKYYLFLGIGVSIVLFINLYQMIGLIIDANNILFYNYNYIGNYSKDILPKYSPYFIVFDLLITVSVAIFILTEQIFEKKLKFLKK
ncbi:hypothetical protein [Flavobacterium sp.]|uniref:hypothetical protein n=1 Tax=Flavobacterium sp. TaxID=239 RepID=UPI003341D1FA